MLSQNSDLKDCFIDSVFPAYSSARSADNHIGQEGILLRVQSPKASFYASAYFFVSNEFVKELQNDKKVFPGSWIKVRNFRGKNYKTIEKIGCKALEINSKETIELNPELQSENDEYIGDIEDKFSPLKEIPFELNGAGKLEISVLNVGQGDLILIKFPSGRGMIIDAHFTPRIRKRVYEKIDSFFADSKPDAILITHKHMDHLRMADELIEKYNISQCWWGVCKKHRHSGPSVRRVLDKIRNREEIMIFSIPGSVRRKDENLELQLLYPVSIGFHDQPDQDPNAHSILVDIAYGESRIILGGDLDGGGWKKQYSQGLPSKIDFLKIPHHCSRNALKIDMIETSNIVNSVTSCGQSI